MTRALLLVAAVLAAYTALVGVVASGFLLADWANDRRYRAHPNPPREHVHVGDCCEEDAA